MKIKTIKIVLVEDDLYYNKALTRYITTICNRKAYPYCDFQIKSYLSPGEAIEELEDDTNIMILDYLFVNIGIEEQVNGADVFDEVKKHCNNCKVVLVSGLQNAQVTAKLMRSGIHEYIDKNMSSSNRIGAVLHELVKGEIAA